MITTVTFEIFSAKSHYHQETWEKIVMNDWQLFVQWTTQSKGSGHYFSPHEEPELFFKHTELMLLALYIHHAFKKYLLNTSYMAGDVLGCLDLKSVTERNRQSPCCCRAYILIGGAALKDTLRKEGYDWMREGDKCYEKQKAQQKKQERGWQGWGSGGGGCKF